MTKVIRIKLSTTPQLNEAIENECTVRQAAGFRLAASFVIGDDLVLIFQK